MGTRTMTHEAPSINSQVGSASAGGRPSAMTFAALFSTRVATGMGRPITTNSGYLKARNRPTVYEYGPRPSADGLWTHCHADAAAPLIERDSAASLLIAWAIAVFPC